MRPPRFAVDADGRWDGWRFLVDCVDGCGASVVVDRAHIVGGARCIDCGRRHHGVPTVVRSSADPTTRMGQGGAHAYPVARRVDGAVSLRKTRIIESMEIVNVDDPRLPAAARELHARVGGRMLLSLARRGDNPSTASWSKVDTWLSVQWRVAGRPPTVMAFWRNGRRDRAMVGGVESSHTAVGAL